MTERKFLYNGPDNERVYEDGWPDLKPLPGLAAVESFDVDLLPEALRPWGVDIAERLQCPLDFPAVAAVVTMAAVVGRKIGIRPKRKDDWTVVPNLWGGIVARPSLLKTPALADPMKMLRRLEVEARKEHERATRDHAASKLVAKAREKERDKAIAAAASKGQDAHAVAVKWIAEDQDEPIRRRYLVNDSTVEKLGVILNDNPNGVLVFRDELVGMLRNLDRTGQESARAFHLEAWNGTGSFTYDRIGRGTLEIDACCISILGGIQPGPLRAYMRDAVRGGQGDDGLVQRFQLLVWPDPSPEWRNVDRWPETASRQEAWAVYQRLDALEAQAIGADAGDEGDEIPFVRFDADGQQLFDDWRAKLEYRLRADQDSDAFIAHLGKYRSLVPSLALLFHLADNEQGGPVGRESADRAIRWAIYLESHAKRLYGAVADQQRGSTKALAMRIEAGDLVDGFTLRDVYRPHWADLGSHDEASEAVDVLTTLGWLKAVEVQTAGRPSTTYAIHPEIGNRAPRASAKSVISPTADPSVTFGTTNQGDEICH